MKPFNKLKFIFILNTLFSFSAFAEDSASKNKELTVFEKQVKSQKKVEAYPNIINLYKPNYILPFYQTDRPYRSVYWGNTPNNQSIKRQELKAHLSFLVPIVHHLIEDKPFALNFAYTQLMYWQVYVKSQYFRETNYEPELFVENYFNSNIAGQLGINHQSNGRGGELERSWNRVYGQLKFSGTNWLTSIRGWFLVDQSQSSSLHNPRIAYYLGYENVLFSYKIKDLKASLELQNLESGLKRGFVQATVSYPLLKSLSIYAQIFNGYGQSLIEYDHKTTGIGIGLALNDWIN